MKLWHYFGAMAQSTAWAVGHPASFCIAVLLVITWAASGPLFGYSDSWQLIINTSTTISTFLMVFLIQHTQNRDSAAVHLKLDELIRAVQDARNSTIALEELDEDQLEELQKNYRKLAADGRAHPDPSEAKPRKQTEAETDLQTASRPS